MNLPGSWPIWGLSNVEIEKTGCIGSCYLEPIVDVYDDEGNLEIRYVKVQPDKVSDIVNRHIVGGEPVWNTEFLKWIRVSSQSRKNCASQLRSDQSGENRRVH